MRIAISGANGYLAKNLIQTLENSQYEVVKIQRTVIYDLHALTKILSGADVVINLSGAPILRRWNKASKAEILSSRTETTRNIVEAINQLSADKRPRTFISASAVGIYLPGMTHTEESTSFSEEFVGEVVKAWEKSSENLSDPVRKVIFRIAAVLGKESQTIKSMLPVFKLGLGGKIGTGKQAFPFVHIDDLTNAVLWAIQNTSANGTYNLVAPESVTNDRFTRELSKKLNRPAIFKVPEWALKMMYGEAASLLTQSPDVYPERLLKSGFKFNDPDIKSCLTEIVG
jgi:uncharacterized protein